MSKFSGFPGRLTPCIGMVKEMEHVKEDLNVMLHMKTRLIDITCTWVMKPAGPTRM